MRIISNGWPPRRLIALAVAISLSIVVQRGAIAQDRTVIEPAGDLPEPVTAADPGIPTEELLLLVKPMTVTELASEKNAWMELVKAKVREISERELTVRRQNAQIAVKKEVVDAVADAKKAVEKAGDPGGAAPETAAQAAESAVQQADAIVQEAVAEAGSEDIAVDVQEASALNLVSTTIATGDNKKIIVPNNSIWGDVITNVTGIPQRRIDMVFGIGYNDDMAKAQEILEKIIAAHPAVLAEPAPNIRVHELADSSVNFIVRPWVKTEDYWSTYWDITRKVKEEFDAQGVSIPFPQRDVHVYHETAAKIENQNETAEAT